MIRYYGNQAWGAVRTYAPCTGGPEGLHVCGTVYDWDTQHSLQAVGTGAIVGREDWGLKVFRCQFYDPEYQYWATRHFEAWRSARVGFGCDGGRRYQYYGDWTLETATKAILERGGG